MAKRDSSWAVVTVVTSVIIGGGALILTLASVNSKSTGFHMSASTWLILSAAVVGLLIIIPIVLAFITPNRRGVHSSSNSLRQSSSNSLRQLQWADLHAWTMRMELWLVGFLLVLAAAAFVAAYSATHSVLESVQQQRLVLTKQRR